MVPSPGLDSWWWRFIENYVYRVPEPPPRTRTTPMQVICVGPPRSGTESLQQALLALGYDYTYHGWDIMFETPHRMPTWARLCRKKWYGAADGEADLTAVDFDAVLGHAAAVTDARDACDCRRRPSFRPARPASAAMASPPRRPGTAGWARRRDSASASLRRRHHAHGKAHDPWDVDWTVRGPAAAARRARLRWAALQLSPILGADFSGAAAAAVAVAVRRRHAQ